MTAFIATAAIAAVLFVWVLRGFLDSEESVEDIAVESSPSLERKYGAYRSILDLEEDFAVGKVSSADRVTLLVEYEAEAIAALRELRHEASNIEDEVEAQLEREIAAVRAALAEGRIKPGQLDGD